MKNITNNAILIGIIGLVVGLVLGWMIGRGNTVTPGNMENEGGETETEVMVSTTSDTESMVENTANVIFSDRMTAEGEGAIMVANQAAGTMVTVGSVETDVSTWVAVREDMNGMAGRVLGAARVDAGESRSVVVKLLRATEAGKKYQINLYKDNGDRTFNTKTDMLIMSGGKAVMQSFMTSAQ